LPKPFAGGIGVFALQGIGQPDFAIAFGQIVLMQLSDPEQVSLQGFDELHGEHGDAVFLSFAIADDDLALGEVQVSFGKLRTSLTRRRTHSMRRRPEPYRSLERRA
jgi:hypothetical protein